MGDHHYPPLVSERDFVLAARLARSHPDYLNDPACPYGKAVKDVLGQPAPTENYQEDLPDEAAIDSLQGRISRLIRELDDYGREEGRSSADKNTYFRLSVSLVKELVDLQKEVSLLSEHEAFVNEILAIMDEICDTDQRATIQERLNKYIGAKNETKDNQISE